MFVPVYCILASSAGGTPVPHSEGLLDTSIVCSAGRREKEAGTVDTRRLLVSARVCSAASADQELGSVPDSRLPDISSAVSLVRALQASGSVPAQLLPRRSRDTRLLPAVARASGSCAPEIPRKLRSTRAGWLLPSQVTPDQEQGEVLSDQLELKPAACQLAGVAERLSEKTPDLESGGGDGGLGDGGGG